MRTSMRPSSAGSSRISNRVLPLLAEAAISIASPLSGTGASVATVAVNRLAATGVVAAESGCVWIPPGAGTPLPEKLIGVWPSSGAARCAWVVGLAGGAIALPEASVFAASVAALPDFGWPAASVGAVTAGTTLSAAGGVGGVAASGALGAPGWSTALGGPFL